MLVLHFALSLILSALPQNVCTLLLVNRTLWHMSTIPSPFSSQLITSNLSSVLNVFCQIFTWIALSDVDLHFSLTLVTKPKLLKRKLYQLCDYIINIIRQHMTDGLTVTSISASLQH